MDAAQVVGLLDSDADSVASYSSEYLQLLQACTEDKEPFEESFEGYSSPENLVSKLALVS